jgi:hypothetical protein
VARHTTPSSGRSLPCPPQIATETSRCSRRSSVERPLVPIAVILDSDLGQIFVLFVPQPRVDIDAKGLALCSGLLSTPASKSRLPTAFPTPRHGDLFSSAEGGAECPHWGAEMIDPSSKAGRDLKAAEEFFGLAKNASSPFMRAYYRRVAERYLSSQGELKSAKSHASTPRRPACRSQAQRTETWRPPRMARAFRTLPMPYMCRIAGEPGL